MAVYGPPGEEVLFHLGAGEAAAIHKYISRKYSNGRWQYTYPSRKTVKKRPKAANRQHKMSSYESEADRRYNRIVSAWRGENSINVNPAVFVKQYYRGIETLDRLISSSSENITDKQVQLAKDGLYVVNHLKQSTIKNYNLDIDFDMVKRVQKYLYSKQGR